MKAYLNYERHLYTVTILKTKPFQYAKLDKLPTLRLRGKRKGNILLVVVVG